MDVGDGREDDGTAPLSEQTHGLEVGADMIRMTPIGRSSQVFFFRRDCRNRDRNVGARPSALSRDSAAKRRAVSMNTEKPQRPR